MIEIQILKKGAVLCVGSETKKNCLIFTREDWELLKSMLVDKKKKKCKIKKLG